MRKFEFQTALRSLTRTWPSTLLSVVVLAVCSAAFFSVAFFAIREFSYERWLPDHERVHRIWLELEEPGEPLRIAVTPADLGPTIAAAAPQVTSHTSLLRYPQRPVLVEVGELQFFEEESVFTTDSGFFDVFGISLLRGDTRTALLRSESLVITDRAAVKYFGTVDCIGETMLFNRESQKVITGVVSSRSGPTHLVYDFLAKQTPDPTPNWYKFNARTYIRLNRGSDKSEVADILRRIKVEKYGDDESDYRYHLQPIEEIHLHSNLLGEFPGGGSAATVRTAILAALIFLGLGATNFAVFEAVRQSARAKEIVIRVVNGASSRQILDQVLTEGLVVSAIGISLGLLVYGLGGARLVGLQNPTSRLLSSPQSWWILAAFCVAVVTIALVASIYPALVGRKVNLAGVTKGSWRTLSSRSSVRQLLVAIQLLIGFALVFASFKVSAQARQLSERTVGFPTGGLFELDLPHSQGIHPPNLRDLLLKEPAITGTSLVSQAPGTALRKASFVPEGNGGEYITVSVLWGDEYTPTVMAITQVAGERFGIDSRANRRSAFLVNQKAAEVFGWDDAVGKRLTLDSGEELLEGHVIGVVADFRFGSVVDAIDPVVIMYAPDRAQKILVRTQPDTDDPKALLETLWKRTVPGEPLRAVETATKLDALNQSNHRLARAGRLIASSAGLVAALGLLALASVLLASRSREISIRRLCGASRRQLTAVLTSELAILIVVVGILAIPIGSYLASQISGHALPPPTTIPIGTYALVIGLFEALVAATTFNYLIRRETRWMVEDLIA